MDQNLAISISKRDNKSVHGPQDRFNGVYVSFYFIGVANLIPWMFFSTAKSYFLYQLRNKTLLNGTDPLDPSVMTRDQVFFLNYVAICSMFPMAITNFLNLPLQKCISAFRRFYLGACLMIIGLSITIVFTQIEIDTKTFLAITLAVVIVLNIGGALAQGSMLGVVAALPPRNIKALMEGQASTGVIAAIANIIVLSTTPNMMLFGCCFFSVALLFVIIAAILWMRLRKNKYFAHYWKNKKVDEPEKEQHAVGSNDETVLETTKTTITTASNICTVMREVMPPGLCVFFTFFVSLSLAPSVFALIRPTHYDANDSWTATYFTPVIVFLLFAVCDFLGRMLGGYIRWPTPERSWLFATFVALRFVFIPLTMLCNEQPRSRIPVLLVGDTWPICLVILTGLTSGYFVSLGVIHGPCYVASERKECAGIAMGIYMALGLSLGVAFSFGLVASL